ncbi:MAG: hypothetical protein WBQ25_09965 [Nitrososphaeraceae archaeon]
MDEDNTSVTMMWQGFKIGKRLSRYCIINNRNRNVRSQALGSFGTNAVEKERTYDPK